MSALIFTNVSAGYPRRPVLHDVNATFAPGKVVGIIGPNGAGKTTLLRAALGLLPFDGRIEILGQSQLAHEARARAIAYLPQGGDAHWPVTARHLVRLGRFPHRTAFSPPSESDEKIVGMALVRADAMQFAERRMNELSAGERARILFARALATEAPILLADEPAAFLVPAHQLRLMGLLKDEATRGTAVAVTLHDLSLAARFCDELLLLDRGRVAEQGTPDSVLSDANLAAVFGIRAVRGESALTPIALL